jgi:hypothetical protein
MLKENLTKIGEAEQSGLSDQLEECLIRHQQLKDAEKGLAGELGIVVAG